MCGVCTGNDETSSIPLKVDWARPGQTGFSVHTPVEAAVVAGKGRLVGKLKWQ